MDEIKKNCQRCNNEFLITSEQYNYLKKKAEEYEEELILPKFCEKCRELKELIKSIPKKIQQVVNLLIQTEKDVEKQKKLKIVFGLALKEIRFNLINFGFMEKKDEQRTEDKTRSRMENTKRS